MESYERIIKANQAECGKSCIERGGTWTTGFPHSQSYTDPCKENIIFNSSNEYQLYCDEPIGNGCHHVFEGYLCLEPTSQHSSVNILFIGIYDAFNSHY